MSPGNRFLTLLWQQARPKCGFLAAHPAGFPLWIYGNKIRALRPVLKWNFSRNDAGTAEMTGPSADLGRVFFTPPLFSRSRRDLMPWATVDQ
jgi:hypothetical protein